MLYFRMQLYSWLKKTMMTIGLNEEMNGSLLVDSKSLVDTSIDTNFLPTLSNSLT